MTDTSKPLAACDAVVDSGDGAVCIAVGLGGAVVGLVAAADADAALSAAFLIFASAFSKLLCSEQAKYSFAALSAEVTAIETSVSKRKGQWHTMAMLLLLFCNTKQESAAATVTVR